MYTKTYSTCTYFITLHIYTEEEPAFNSTESPTSKYVLLVALMGKPRGRRKLPAYDGEKEIIQIASYHVFSLLKICTL
jgi:hypothetical protein